VTAATLMFRLLYVECSACDSLSSPQGESRNLHSPRTISSSEHAPQLVNFRAPELCLLSKFAAGFVSRLFVSAQPWSYFP
jgi:hypothetical protein